MGGVITYSEDPVLASEAAAAGAEVAGALRTVSWAVEVDEVTVGLRCAGDVLLLKGQTKLEADADSVASGLVEVARARGVQVLVVGESRFGTLVAAKFAARLKSGALGKGRGLRAEAGSISIERDVYGGKYLARVESKTPCVAVVQAGAYLASGSSHGPVETIEIADAAKRVKVVEKRAVPRSSADLKSAQIIVAVGRGFARRDDLKLAQLLADTLGAALACSRPISSDLGWMGEEARIGLTGAYVHPRLYIAVGISGQMQHVAGIKDSKIIVAVNKDKQAPIFQSADYGIVGDLYDVLPALAGLLKKP